MISEKAKKYAVNFHGVDHYPVNVCSHCGETDDPEGHWAEDADGDRICGECEEKELRDTQCADCFEWFDYGDPHTCKRQIAANRKRAS